MAQEGTVHQQLAEKLRALVQSGTYAPGSKFPTEREIARQYQTSRPTANKALSGVVSEGVLEFRKGVGTFVRKSVLDYDLQRLVSFTDKAKAVGKVPGTELIEYRDGSAGEASAGVVEALGVEAEERLIYMERVRKADDEPVIFERRWVVAKLCQEMSRAEAEGSLYACWTEKCGLSIAGADEVIRAVNARGEVAERLGVEEGAACFLIEATGFIEGDVPLWREETYYRAEVYEFRNRLGGIADWRPAVGVMR